MMHSLAHKACCCAHKLLKLVVAIATKKSLKDDLFYEVHILMKEKYDGDRVDTRNLVLFFSEIVWSKLKSQKALERWQPDTEVSCSEVQSDVMINGATFTCTVLLWLKHQVLSYILLLLCDFYFII